MYLHIGGNCVIENSNVVGVFDIEKDSSGAITRDYLNNAGKSGQVVYLTGEMPRSFIVTLEKGKQVVYLTQISPATIMKRQKQGLFGELRIEN